MTWHYLPVYVETNGERAYSLCEAYLDEDGRLEAWSANRAMAPHGTDSPDALLADLDRMRRDVRRWEPVAFDTLTVGMQVEPRLGRPDGKTIPDAVLGNEAIRNIMSGRPDETKD